MSTKNSLIVAAAGAGKTTHLVNLALSNPDVRVLIATYTRSNASEIRSKIRALNFTRSGLDLVPENIVVEEWFTFLLKHGVRPFKALIDNKLTYQPVGFNLTETKSGVKNRYFNKHGNEEIVYWGEDDNLMRFYFTRDFRIHSDKISKFVFKCNEISDGGFCERISNNYDFVLIDEVQDLAGWDLEIIKLLFESNAKIVLVGDPRQTVYLTNNASKNLRFRDGKIVDFVKEQCNNQNVEIDFDTLNKTHRNCAEIASFSSKLYPNYPATEPCECEEHRKYNVEYEGIYLIRPDDLGRLSEITENLDTRTLKFKGSSNAEINIGISKGLTFDQVIVYPTNDVISWIKGTDNLADSTRARFYVALTRSRYASFVVYDYRDEEEFIDGIKLFDSDRLQDSLFFGHEQIF